MKISYFLKSSKKDKIGLTPIYIRVRQPNKKPIQRSTGIKVSPKNWRPNPALIRNDRDATQHLRNLSDEITKIGYKSLFVEDADISIQIDKLLGRPLEQLNIESIVKKWLVFIYKDNSIKHKTKGSYYNKSEIILNHLQLVNLNLTPFDRFTHRAETKLMDSVRKEYSQNTAHKVNQLLIRIIKWGSIEYDKQIIPLDNIVKYHKEEEIIHIEPTDFEVLKYMSFGTSAYIKIRDLMLIQSYTGFAYGDLMDFLLWCQNDNQLDDYIERHRKKTGIKCIIPVSDDLRRLIELYQAKGEMPIVTNSYYNRVMKEVSNLCGITYYHKITTHTCRRTAGFRYLNMGMSIESVAKILGHTDIRTTQRYYAKVTKDRVLREYAECKKVG